MANQAPAVWREAMDILEQAGPMVPEAKAGLTKIEQSLAVASALNHKVLRAEGTPEIEQEIDKARAWLFGMKAQLQQFEQFLTEMQSVIGSTTETDGVLDQLLNGWTPPPQG